MSVLTGLGDYINATLFLGQRIAQVSSFAGIKISSSIYSNDASLLQKVQALQVGKNIKDYTSAELTAIKTVLTLWLRKMRYYAEQCKSLAENAPIADYINKIFGKSDKPNKTLWLALKAFAYCYGEKFNGAMTQGLKNAFIKIADGSFDEPGSVYRLKTTERHCAYNNVWKYGLEKGLKRFNALKDTVKNKPNPMCKKYKIGEKSDYILLINHCLSLWLSKMSYPGKEEDIKKLSNNNEFTLLTVKAWYFLDYQLGINADMGEVKNGHLKYLKALLNGNSDTTFPALNGLQEQNYDLVNLQGPEKAFETLSERSKHRPSRFDYLNQSFKGAERKFFVNCDRPWRIYGYVSSKKIDDALHLTPRITNLLNWVNDYLISINEGYSITITSGKRPRNKFYGHRTGNAVDIVLKKNGKYINAPESKIVMQKLINKFGLIYYKAHHSSGEPLYINEYIERTPNWNGPHIHLEIAR